MNMVFETRQKAAELMKEAIAIWRQSDQSDYLEGLENDPVFSLMMMAIAYQGNEIDSEIERLKEETLDEFARQLTPYEIGHATPASIVVQTALQSGVAEVEVSANSGFQLPSGHTFLPLLKTRVLNAKVASVVRVDGRRWKVVLEFPHALTDLCGFTFAVDGLEFRDLTVSVNKYTLPLIKPWDYSEWPFSECFAPQNMLYHHQQVCNMSMLPFELFAQHNLKIFCVGACPKQLLPPESEHLELMFEFSGITDQFPFDKTHLLLNTLILVNAQQEEATLTSLKPFERIAGGPDTPGRQFLHLLQPLENQIFGSTELEVRQVCADRFNRGSLIKLLHCIINKYHSDFYAFQDMKGMTTDSLMYNLHEAMKAIMDAAEADPQQTTRGIYLLLKNRAQMRNKDFSLAVRYLTTAGAAVNAYLNDLRNLSSPSGFDSSATRVLASPVPGTDAISSDADATTMLRYYMLTNDRIVTPADIKMFCRKELQLRYKLSSDMIRNIHVSHRLSTDRRDSGYEILADITLADHPYVVRTFTEHLVSSELLLQKQMEIRSTGIFPIAVSIHIETT